MKALIREGLRACTAGMSKRDVCNNELGEKVRVSLPRDERGVNSVPHQGVTETWLS